MIQIPIPIFVIICVLIFLILIACIYKCNQTRKKLLTVRNIESEPSASGSVDPEYRVEKGTRKFDDAWKKKRRLMNTKQRLERTHYKMELRKNRGENIQTVKLRNEKVNIPTPRKYSTARNFENHIEIDAEKISTTLNHLEIHHTEQYKTVKDTVNRENIMETTEIYPEIHENPNQTSITGSEMVNGNKNYRQNYHMSRGRSREEYISLD